MKKMLLVFVATIMAFSFSAFAPQKTSVEELWYEDDEGNPVEYVGANECPPITTNTCLVEIGGKTYRLYYDPLFISTVPGHD